MLKILAHLLQNEKQLLTTASWNQYDLYDFL